MSLSHLILVNRPMGCEDESASDEEQAEKVLFFYPESTTLNEQLVKINMLEGLIDFSSKFCREPINSVIMQGNTWSFYECEPGIWLIAAVSNKTVVDYQDKKLGLFNHQVNSYGLEASIRRFYSMYFTFNGKIVDSIAGPQRKGLEAIDLVRMLRKQLRKLKQRLKQEKQDLASLESREQSELGNATCSNANSTNNVDSETTTEKSVQLPVEHIGIKTGKKTISQAQADVDATNLLILEKVSSISDGLSDPHYSPVQVRDSIQRFARWYLSTGEMSMHTAIQALMGTRQLHCMSLNNPWGGASSSSNYITVSGTNVGSGSSGANSPVNGSNSNGGTSIASGDFGASGIGGGIGNNTSIAALLMRMRMSVAKATKGSCRGLLVVRDGRVLWSDMNADVTHTLCEFARMQDVQYVQNQVATLLHYFSESKSLQVSTNAGRMYSETDAEIEGIMQRCLRELLTRKGMVVHGWDVLDLEETRITPLLTSGLTSFDGPVGIEPEKAVTGAGSDTNGIIVSTRMEGSNAPTTAATTDSKYSPTIIPTTGVNNTTTPTSVRGRASTIGFRTGMLSVDSVRQTSIFSLSDVLVDDCHGASRIYCPRVHANCHGIESSMDSRDKHRSCIGRAIFYRHYRTMVVVLVPDWSTTCAPTSDAGPLFHLEAVQRFVTTINDQAATPTRAFPVNPFNNKSNIRGSDYVSEIITSTATATTSSCKDNTLRSSEVAKCVEDNAECLNSSDDSVSPMEYTRDTEQQQQQQHNIADCEGPSIQLPANNQQAEQTVKNPGKFGHACLITLCAFLQVALAPDCLRVEKQLRSVYYEDETVLVEPPAGTVNNSSTNAMSSSSSLIASEDSTVTTSSNNNSQTMRMLFGTTTGSGGSSSPGSKANGGTSRNNGSLLRALMATRAPPNKDLTCTAGHGYNTTASVVPLERPAVISAGTDFLYQNMALAETALRTRQSAFLKDVKFIYYNATDATMKVCGINRNDLSPVLSVPKQFRDLMQSKLRDGRDPYTRKLVHIIADKLTDKLGFKMPVSSVLLSGCLEPAIVQALNDIWIQLQVKGSANGSFSGIRNGRNVSEACLRVSTAQRGGVWVTGRRIGYDTPHAEYNPRARLRCCGCLYMIITNCGTMNDMYEAFDELVDVLLLH